MRITKSDNYNNVPKSFLKVSVYLLHWQEKEKQNQENSYREQQEPCGCSPMLSCPSFPAHGVLPTACVMAPSAMTGHIIQGPEPSVWNLLQVAFQCDHPGLTRLFFGLWLQREKLYLRKTFPATLTGPDFHSKEENHWDTSMHAAAKYPDSLVSKSYLKISYTVT